MQKNTKYKKFYQDLQVNKFANFSVQELYWLSYITGDEQIQKTESSKIHTVIPE